MNRQQTDWIEILRNTIRYRPAVQETAARFKGLSSSDYVDLARRLIDSGEDKALGILLLVCTINAMKLDPVLLAETIKVVEPIDDFSPPYRLQDKSAIAPLLSVAQAKDISWERQAYVGLLAAELAVRFDSDHQNVKRALLKLSSKIRSPIDQYMINQALILLETTNQDEKDIQFESMRDPLDRLPEEKPPVVTGGTYTVRRTVPKLGRNEPCHCGSGKKYKKCCFEKDQELMRDASPYEGVTMTRARAIPGLVDDAGIIDEMRAYELKKLDPSKLNTHQLYAAFHRAELFGLGKFAFNILLELERRPGKEAFDIGHFEDLLDSALDEGDTVLAEKIMDHVPVESFTRPELIHVCYHLVKDRDRFAGLEAQCRQALTDPDDFMWDDPILHFGHTLEKIYPALSIVFSRASMMGKPDRSFDNEVLLDVIRNARAEIDLDPWMDPAEDYFEWTSDQHDRSLEEKNKNKEIEGLTNKASEARIRATDTEKELRERENELQDLAKKLEKEKQSSAAKTQLPESKDPLPEGDRQTVARLRQQIESLKGEVQSQQQTKRQLRHQLRQAQREIIKRQGQSQPEKPSSEQVSSLKPEKSPKKILIPDFTPGFQSSCESMPASIVAKALRASAAFAAHDQPIWRQTTTIKRLPNIYRIRLTIDHRLMIRWQPDERLQVLEIIPRSQLETWIRQHAR